MAAGWLALSAAVHSEDSLREMLVKDWLDRDAAFCSAASSGAAQAFSDEHVREISNRARALAQRIQNPSNHAALDSLLGLLVTVEGATPTSEEERRGRYFETCGVAREIAFCNSLLDFDRILFIKRHDARGEYHMCDQFYGFNGVPGGGLYVLHEPFGPEPRVQNLLENSVVESGRLQGRRLDTGAFLAPELSFDGNTILFAYTEAKGQDLEWTRESCYHLFRVHADGSGLAQLTDGPWDDFDPCFLPNGRVAFVSERCGGYLRCGRHCPTYTMFSMAANGSDIRALSHHETHEWQPSVNNDGMLVYTRWDYVDRDTNIAHHLWTCYPDGRDPRSFHGNYPLRREGRPWMEMDIRAIPGSHQYVATTGAHHGHAFGALVLIDPRREDDGAMGQITRLTPEVPFPEAERDQKPIPECMVYGTAWPLDENDYLCVYDRLAKNRGVYWMDRFGNKELLYRDPGISCLSPIPLRARPMPPVIPDQVASEEDAPATVAVMNVYDSDFAWPENARVTALRIIQVLPKTTPPPNEPRIGVAEQTNARAVLGTVPVEEDGSAHFTVPPGREVYFQALDENGFAIQSMRSGTYFQPGERLTCAGCHERKHQAASAPKAVPLALRRGPSALQPGPDGSNPFSYVRLVQPVLDRQCVACHVEKEALDLAGSIEGSNGWTRSYHNLAERYGFYYHVRNGSVNDGVHGGVRAIAGQFGAAAAPLLAFLDERHYGLTLPPEDRQRITLWLDCNSEFYGAYENTPAQSRGKVVHPALH
jgi:hypothetical protein